jgi:lysophospholipase L1-like esterase
MRRMLKPYSFLAAAVIWLGAAAWPSAQQGAPAPGAATQGGGVTGGVAAPGRGPAGPPTPATVPFENPRNATRHQGFLDVAKAGNIDLLFVGDSITDGWRNRGLEVWNKHFAPLKAANFGIGGDTTQGVLWRMQNGELEGFKARLIVLMLGTNNLNRNPHADIVEGDRLIVEEFKKRQPQAKVLILGIFPRSADPAHANRAAIKEVNGMLAKLADNRQVFYMDIGDKFLAADGTLTTEIMPDGLHPSLAGYQIWADAISERVKTLMQ